MKTEMTEISTISRKEIDRMIARARQERSDWIAVALRGLFRKSRRPRVAVVPAHPLSC